MEMLPIHQYQLLKALFKIDLIVWKFIQIIETMSCCIKFKIDLIVWKLSNPSHIFNYWFLFKIDLIVWKYN